MTFSKNPNYREREVLLGGAEFLVMRDAAARLAVFRVGQLDYGSRCSRRAPAGPCSATRAHARLPYR